jgi:hypothetical protein
MRNIGNIGQIGQIGKIKMAAAIIGAAKGIRALSRIFTGRPKIAATSTKKINS